MQTPKPAALDAPGTAPMQVTIAGAPASDPAAVYQALRAQSRELAGQMRNLQENRADLSRQLEQTASGSSTRAGIEQRIAAIDQRAAAVDKQISDADAQVAKAAAIPGAAVEPPRFVRDGPPDEVYFLGGMFMVIVLLPLSIAYARRVWRRGAAVVINIPKEIGERLGRMEQSVEATALEVERIGEGQRFLTRLFTDGPGARALGAPQGEVVDRKSAGPD